MEKVNPKNELVPKTPDGKDSKHDNVKKSGDKRPADSTRKFAVMSSEFIKIVADSIGISEIPDDTCAALAEDLSYKLREVIHVSALSYSN